MSNASSCRRAAAHFARLAAHSESAEERRAYGELQQLWSEMAALAVRFDCEHDDRAKAAIYAMMGEVEEVRHRVA
ncbi:MAG: hypothetical protein ACRED5_21660 [Propylenella sp.]